VSHWNILNSLLEMSWFKTLEHWEDENIYEPALGLFGFTPENSPDFFDVSTKVEQGIEQACRLNYPIKTYKIRDPANAVGYYTCHPERLVKYGILGLGSLAGGWQSPPGKVAIMTATLVFVDELQILPFQLPFPWKHTNPTVGSSEMPTVLSEMPSVLGAPMAAESTGDGDLGGMEVINDMEMTPWPKKTVAEDWNWMDGAGGW
jgi:hypothetical protein